MFNNEKEEQLWNCVYNERNVKNVLNVSEEKGKEK
jgi:hypothetical protein